MPIKRDELDPILPVDETATVRQVVGKLLSGEPYTPRYTVVVSRQAGDFNAFTLVELDEHAERLGPAALDEKLGELLADEPRAKAVEWAKTKNLRRAEDDAWSAPGKRLLVLQDGQPLGIVTGGTRSGKAQAAVIQLYQAGAEPAPEVLAEAMSHLETDFLLLRPQVTLAEVDRALSRADVLYAIAPLYDDQCVLLDRQDVEPFLDELGRYTLRQIYTVRKAGEPRPSAVVTGTDVNRFRPKKTPSHDEIILLHGKPIGYRSGPDRSGSIAYDGGFADDLEGAPLGGDERYVNAWFKDHDSSQALARGAQYDLGINVGAQRADSYTVGETYRGPVDRDVYVGLVGDPDAWRIDGPAVQKLHIPATGDSEEVFFQVTPLKQGQQQLVAHFYYRNHLVQTVEITGIQVAISDEVGASTVVGQSPVAVTLTRAASGAAASDRDANLYIEWLPDQDRFRFTYFSAPRDGKGEPVLRNARVPLTADEMTVMADAARDVIETHLIRYEERGTLPFCFLSKDKDQQPSDKAYHKAVMELSNLGYRWFIRLFYSTKEPDLVAEAEAMGHTLLQASAGGPLRLQVVSSDFYLPWNLFYTPLSGKQEALTDENANVEALWGFRHVIEQVPARDLSHVFGGPIIEADDGLNMGASVNLNIDGDEYQPAADQVAYFESRAAKPELKLALTTRFTEDEVLKAFQDKDNAEEIIYFYCHAATKGDPKTRFEKSRLILTKPSRALTLGKLITATFGTPKLAQAPLVFLNACGSAEMDAQFYDSFVQFMRDKGARTVIGTLNNTPSVVGAIFAMSFMGRFLKGGPENSAAQLLFDLRREFLDAYRNPVGLSYALFYNGDTFVKRKA